MTFCQMLILLMPFCKMFLKIILPKSQITKFLLYWNHIFTREDRQLFNDLLKKIDLITVSLFFELKHLVGQNYNNLFAETSQ